MSKFLSILTGVGKGIWRIAGPVAIGAATQYATANPYAALALTGISKVAIPAVKQYYKDHGKEVPGWIISLPF